MKQMLLICSLFFFLPFFISAQTPFYQTIPNDYVSTPGTAAFTGPLASTARTYQMLIHADQLTAIVGKELKGLSWRLPANATANWPAGVEVTYSNYDFYLSGSVPPADRSLTFTQNVVGTQIQVRSGSLEILRESYTFGNIPNNFGPEIMFTSPYLYSGGHLLIEMRQNGSNGTSRSNDGISSTGPGYLSSFSALWNGNYVPAVTGTNGNFSVIRLTADNPTPVELTSFTASVVNNTVQLNWSTSTETNNKGFQVERKISEGWMNLGFVPGAGTTTETMSYSFNDKAPQSGSNIYRLKQVDYDGTYEYSKEIQAEGVVASEYLLDNCYPNPANPGTVISYNVASESQVRIILYNTMGQVVKEICNQKQDAGYYRLNLDGKDLASGIYLYTMQAVSTSGTEHFTATKKFVLIK